MSNIKLTFSSQKCYHPDFPEANAVCCKIPDDVGPKYLQCAPDHECLPSQQCDAYGNVNTDGAGLFDLRVKAEVDNEKIHS